MSSYLYGKFAGVGVGQLLRRPRNSRPRTLYKYIQGEDLIQVADKGITLVFGRRVRKNVRVSADIAIGIAKQNPATQVLYLNTYAGIDLLLEEFQSAMLSAGYPVTDIVMESEAPPGSPDPTPGISSNGSSPAPPTASHLTTENPDTSTEDLLPTTEFLPNLQIVESAMGCWNSFQLRKSIEKYGSTVVVLNSFEFAPLGRSQKDRVARELLDLKRDLGLTLIVLSHDMRSNIEAGVTARGAIGVLSGHASSLAKLFDPFDLSQPKNKRSKSAGIDTVHEKQMHSSSDANELEADEFFGDYLEDPWIGTDERPGNELYCYARKRRLKEFFAQRMSRVFRKGEPPSEEQLEWSQEGQMKFGIVAIAA